MPSRFDELEGYNAGERMRWAASEFPQRAVATSSFGADSAVLLHLISTEAPMIPVVFLDTGFLFPETLAYRETLRTRLGLNVQTVRPEPGRIEFIRQYGEVYRSDPDFCCGVNKVAPLNRALQGMACWISGIRRHQTSGRAATRVAELQSSGVLKINPLADWHQEDIDAYRNRFDLPVHPLAEQGYTSIGCEPCTRLPTVAGDARSGRWGDEEKTECGLHLSPSADPELAAQGDLS